MRLNFYMSDRMNHDDVFTRTKFTRTFHEAKLKHQKFWRHANSLTELSYRSKIHLVNRHSASSFLERGQRVLRISIFVLLRPRNGPPCAPVSLFPLAKMLTQNSAQENPAVTLARNLHSAYPRPFAEIEVAYSSWVRPNSNTTTYESLPADRCRD